MNTKCLPLAVAAFGGLSALFGTAAAQNWKPTTAPIAYWNSVASSADGTRLVAVAGDQQSAQIYTSTDGGASWRSNSTMVAGVRWYRVASSADGMRLVAVAESDLVGLLPGAAITSTNGGGTWIPSGPSGYWRGIASSADGTKLALGTLVACGGPEWNSVYTSADSGGTWTMTDTPSGYSDYLMSLACSADGARIALGINRIYTTTNSGTIWLPTSAPSAIWSSMASTADGVGLLAVSGSSYQDCMIYSSKDSGATWSPISEPRHWASVACSADGTRVVAAVNGGGIYTSTDAGATWIQSDAPPASWTSVASSADGSKLVAAADYDGSIYTAQSVPAPSLSLKLSGGSLVISWTVPSINFILQQSSDLMFTNATQVPFAPILNYTDIRYEVTVPMHAGSMFYRLVSQ